MASPSEGTLRDITTDGELQRNRVHQNTSESTQGEAKSPHNSPKRKSQGSFRGGGKPVCETQRRKTERRTTWKSRLMNSLRRKPKRSGRSTGDIVEASEFSFRQPSRGSPIASSSGSGKMRQSPSLDLHKLKRPTHSSLETIRTAIAEDVDSLPQEIRGGTPLHFYVWTDHLKKDKKERTEFLVSLLTAGEVEVDCKSDEGNTPLHLAVQKGDLEAVKVVIAFGANVNCINSRGQTPLDIATTGYINQEHRLAVSNMAHNNRLRRQSANVSPKSSRSDLNHQQRGSPLVSKIVPLRPKFVDFHLNGDFDGWVNVDFTDGPRILKRPVSVAGTEVRLRDLTDPVHITKEDLQHTMTTEVTEVSTPKNDARRRNEEEELRQAFDDILNLLHATGGMSSQKLQSASSMPLSLSGQHAMPDLSTELQRSVRLIDYEDGTTILNLYEALEDTINRKMEELSSLHNLDEAVALALQQQEMKRYDKTLARKYAGDGVDGGGRAGSRVLCLDGGGVRGLIQIEILSQIERVTGRKIIDLFDWIIGTSTGAIIALCLTYAEMSLDEIRLLYFKMKNEVFCGNTYGFDTATLERILQETFPTHMCMDCPTSRSTNVLVSAVYKRMSPPQLHFFNNCFGDNFSTLWKVARYTSAAPMFFKECDDYVDGGVLANNPSETGLTAIQNFHHSRGLQLPIALVVSIGSGIYPAVELGKIDVQDFLFFGKQWLNFHDTVRRRAKNLMQLLGNALVESETVAKNTKARCEGQGTPYYRLSPKLAETVATSETDNTTLIDMIISTIAQTAPRMEALREEFIRIAEANQKERFRKRRDNISAKVTTL